MARFTLRRRDRVNHGEVGCPSGMIYKVDMQGCVEVDSEEDRDALLEVGRPPRCQRLVGKDGPGFWELIMADGRMLIEGQEPAAPTSPSMPLPVPADPAALKTFGVGYPGGEEVETVVEAEEVEEAETGVADIEEEEDTPLEPEPATPAAPVSSWREAASPVFKQACQGRTAAGQACRRPAVKGELYCAGHLKKEG